MVTQDVWNCKAGDGHYQAVSACCGADMHSDVDSMCGACNEWTGWVCVICDAEMDSEVYN